MIEIFSDIVVKTRTKWWITTCTDIKIWIILTVKIYEIVEALTDTTTTTTKHSS